MKILLARTDAIGDTLLTLPVIKFLKKEGPKAKIGPLVGPKLEGLMPLIDSVKDFVEEYWIFDQSWPFQKKKTSSLPDFHPFFS